jgi:DNA-binding transcriptional regulator/RsmH inhibitor MraZ
MTKTEIFQIYFDDQQLAVLDPAFTPLLNTNKNQLQYREWTVLHQSLLIGQSRDLDIWGFTSWKWYQKIDRPGSDFLKLIADNPDSKCWFLEPVTRDDDIFDNSWKQGDLCHPGMFDLAQTIFDRLGYKINVRTDKIPNCFFNYFAMDKATWEKYMETLDQVKEIVDADPELSHMMYVKQAEYTFDSSLPFWIFFVERFITSFVIHENIPYSTLRYNNSVFINEFYR